MRIPIFSIFLAVSAHAAVVRVDFGGVDNTTTETGVTWNNLTTVTTGSAIANLDDVTGADTGIRLEITGAFRGVNGGGTTSSTLFPANATRDSFFGNTVGSGGFPGTFPNGQVTLSGLSAFETYDLLFYASRVGDSVNRSTQYTATGGNGTQSVTLNSNNINGSVELTGLTADANGRIIIGVGPGAGNATTEQFYYLGVLQVTSVPEPSSLLLSAGMLAMLGIRRRA